MKQVFILALLLLIAPPCFAARKISSEGMEYFPVFGLGTVTSVSYSITAGSVGVNSGNGEATEIVSILCTTDCHVKESASPIANSTDMFIPAKTERIFEIKNGHRVSVAQDASSGFLYLTHFLAVPNSN